MIACRPNAPAFSHATLRQPPAIVAGLTLTDEDGGAQTGIYHRDPAGNLWACRMVDRSDEAHHRSVIQVWIETTPGDLQDLRSAKP